MNHRTLALALAALFAGAGCGGSTSPGTTKPVRFTASLTTGGEIGSTLAGNVAGSAGTFNAELDTITGIFRYSMTFSNMSSAVAGASIHGPFAIGGGPTTAPAILDLDPTAANTPLSSTATFVKGTTTGTGGGILELAPSTAISPTVSGDSLAQLLLAGKTYVNISTLLNGGGEVRGQLTIVP